MLQKISEGQVLSESDLAAPLLKMKSKAPAKPLNAFNMFCKDKRATVRLLYPSLSGTELSGKLGEVWHDMTAADRSKYEEEYKKNLEKYTKDMEEYRANAEDEYVIPLPSIPQKQRGSRKSLSESTPKKKKKGEKEVLVHQLIDDPMVKLPELSMDHLPPEFEADLTISKLIATIPTLPHRNQ